MYLYHKDIRFRITSFKDDFISGVEINWENIRNAILNLFSLMKSFGLNDYTLTTHNATLPILYYIYHKDISSDFSIKVAYKEDREIMKKWLFAILIRRTFGAQTDTVLSQSRKAFVTDIDATKFDNIIPSTFPADEINKQIRKIVEVGDDFIEELLLSQKDSQYSFPILALLYPDLDYKNNNFDQDHTHPATSYEQLTDKQKKEYSWKVYNSILNLQMLDANENKSKNAKSLKSWVDETTANSDRNRFLENHIIPNVGLDLSNFSEYIEERKKLLINKMKEILS